MEDGEAEGTVSAYVWIAVLQDQTEAFETLTASNRLLESGKPSDIVARPVHARQREAHDLWMAAASRAPQQLLCHVLSRPVLRRACQKFLCPLNKAVSTDC